MRKPLLIFRAGNCTARKYAAFLLVIALLLACSARLYRSRTGQGSVEVFAGEERASEPPQGLYALLEQWIGD